MYPYNNNNNYNNQPPYYPNQYNQPYGDISNSPYPSGISSMPTPDFSVNNMSQQNMGGNYGYPPQNYPPNYPNYPNDRPNYPNQTPYFPNQQPNYPPNYSNQSQNNQFYPPAFPMGGGNNNFFPNNQPTPPNSTSNLFPNLPPQTQNNNYGNVATNLYNNPSNNWNNNQQPVYNNYASGYEGTVKPNPHFNPTDDAAKLYKAMKGFGTDETTLIDIICRRTNQERLQIASSFKTGYGKDLLKDVKSETSGNFGSLLTSLLMPRIEFEAYSIRNAIAGAGTDEIALIDVICTKRNSEMQQLKATYKRLFNKEIENDVKSDVSGYFKRILVSLINANRSEAPADLNRARQLAQELYQAGEKRLGTDEVKFNQIFACESLDQLKLVFDEYYKLTGHDIEKAINSEMSGDVRNAFLAIAQIAKYPPGYYAQRLYKSMKGLGTDDSTLIRNVVLRSEVDMREIKMEFQKRYSKTLESFIKGDCSGDYKRALLCLVGDPHWK